MFKVWCIELHVRPKLRKCKQIYHTLSTVKESPTFNENKGHLGYRLFFCKQSKNLDLLIFLGGTEGCYGFDLFCSQGLLLFLQLLNPFRQPNSTIRWRKTKRHWMRRTWVVPSDPCSVAILLSSLCWTASLWKIGQHVFVPLWNANTQWYIRNRRYVQTTQKSAYGLNLWENDTVSDIKVPKPQRV